MPIARQNTMLTGKVIGDKVQYRLDTPVAVGAFSTVYRCTELASGRSYAMKIIDKKVAADNHMKEALIREVNALEVAGSSPYVTTLVDKMVSRHNYYLVMELAEGGTLLDLIREQRQEIKVLQASLSTCRDFSESLRSGVPPVMQYDRVQHFFKQLLLALSSLHDHDVVHRDVKPENILLNKRRTRLVLSDFGFACHAPPGTELHRACGTLRYCAPELLHENPRYEGRKVDVWAAGVTLYVMLFGGHPFRCPSQDPDSLLEVITTTRFRIPRPIPAEIEDMLQHMLCVDPMERWSVKQLLQHPWMTSLGAADLRTSSLRSSSPTGVLGTNTALSSTATITSDTAEAVAELLSEDCPPIDALPSDEEVVDDGFYQSSTDDKHSSSLSSSPTQSGASTQLPAMSARTSKAGSLTGVPEGVVADVLDVVGAATQLSGKVSSPTIRTTAAVVAVAAVAPTAPQRREVLKQGTVSTSMVAIESSQDSESDSDVAAGAEAEVESVDEDEDDVYAHGAAHSVNAANPVRAARSASSDAGSSVSTHTFREDGELSRWWWSPYAYGLYLTLRSVARFLGFFGLCMVAVAVRVLLRRDIVDLPLPEVVRNYVAFLLSTPLRQSHLAAHRTVRTPLSFPGENSNSSNEDYNASAHRGPPAVPRSAEERAASTAQAQRQRNVSPIPGSGLRHYVRSADRLMRDSFVGNAVLEHNASLTEPQLSTTQASRELSDASLTSSPAAPSLATIAPVKPSSSAHSFLTERLPSTPSLQTHPSKESELADERTAAGSRRASCHESAAVLTEENVAAASHHLNKEPPAPSVSSTHTSPLITLVATSPVLNSPAVAAKAATNEKVKSEGGPHVDSQGGATESGDSGDDKSPDSARHHAMFSPIAPLPRAFPGHRQRTEDFPVVNNVN